MVRRIGSMNHFSMETFLETMRRRERELRNRALRERLERLRAQGTCLHGLRTLRGLKDAERTETVHFA